jgi:hypothetical protein
MSSIISITFSMTAACVNVITLKIDVSLVSSNNALIAVTVAASIVISGLTAGLIIGFVSKNSGPCKVPVGQTSSQYGNYRFTGVTGSTKVCSPVGTWVSKVLIYHAIYTRCSLFSWRLPILWWLAATPKTAILWKWTRHDWCQHRNEETCVPLPCLFISSPRLPHQMPEFRLCACMPTFPPVLRSKCQMLKRAQLR